MTIMQDGAGAPKQVREFFPDRLLHAGALALLVLVPLYFNAASLGSFERDKTALLRVVALLMISAFAMRAIAWREEWRAPALLRDCGVGRIVVVLAAILLLLQAVSTALSIAPSISLVGDYHRMQGLYTAGAYVVVFVALATIARERHRMEQVVDTILLASAPVALYGLLQHFGLDSLAWARPSRSPVLSTMGNELFVAAYLIMTVPLTVYRLLTVARQVRGPDRAGYALALGALLSLVMLMAGWWMSLTAGIAAALAVLGGWAGISLWRRGTGAAAVSAAGLLILLSVQLGSIAFSESRGPFLGLLAGLGLLGLLWAVIYDRQRFLVAVVLSALVAVACLIAVNLPGSPLGPVAEMPVIGRLTQIFTTEGTAQVRLLIWEAVLERLGEDPWRLLTGHGPDATRLALQPYYHPGLARPSSMMTLLPDRAHNDSLDWLVTTGVPGLAAYCALLASVMVVALRAAGLAAGRTAAAVLAAQVVAIVLAALVLRLALGSWQLVGLAVPAGVLTGIGGYLVFLGISRRSRTRDPACQQHALMPAALMSALTAHVVEAHVGIATVSTQLTFWALCALVVVCAGLADSEGSGEAEAAPEPSLRPYPVTGLMFVAFLVALTLGFDFAATGTRDSVSLPFTWLFAATFMLMAPIILSRGTMEPERPRFRSLEIFGFYGAACLAGLLVARLATGELADWLELDRAGFATHALLVVTLIALLSIGASWPPGPAPTIRGLRDTVALALGLGGLWLAWTIDIRLVRADEAAKQGWEAEQRQDYARAVTAYRRAVTLTTSQDRYHGLLGAALSRQAVAADQKGEHESLFEAAEAALLRARALSPLDVEHVANLARLQVLWADKAPGSAQRDRHLRDAVALYAQAAERSPGRPDFLTEWGGALAKLADYETAKAKLSRARDLRPDLYDVHALLGNVHVRLAEWEAAREAFERAISLRPAATEPRIALAAVHLRLERLSEAKSLFHEALALDPTRLAVRRALAVLHLQQGECRAAAALVREGLALGWDDHSIRVALSHRCGIRP